jgi:hypothetical protein
VEKPVESVGEQGLRLQLRLPASMFPSLAERVRDFSRGAAILKIIEVSAE